MEPLVATLDALGLAARPSAVPAPHDGVHRDRVLQARHRRDQGPRGRVVAELEKRLADSHTRHADHHQRQRLPQLVRAHPGRRHRAQGPVGPGRRDQVEGFQVHLGGGSGLDAGFGRKLRGLKITAAELPDYVERVARRYVAGRERRRAFAQWVARADEEELHERARRRYYCPYCAEEDLRPVEQHGGWECRSCLRVFAVKVLGLAPRVTSLAGPSTARKAAMTLTVAASLEELAFDAARTSSTPAPRR